MLQIRGRDGNDKRWYSPERDIVHVFPRIFRKSLDVFEGFEGDDEASVEDVGEAAKVFARIINDFRNGSARPDKVKDELRLIQKGARDKIARAFLLAFVSEFGAWCADAMPKSRDDAPLEFEELEGFLNEFASTRSHAGGNDE